MCVLADESERTKQNVISKKESCMTKEDVAAIAIQEGSENGPLGGWKAAWLDERPEAGMIVCQNGNWYVAVAGRCREGYRGYIGGLYARWVQVPAEECADW